MLAIFVDWSVNRGRPHLAAMLILFRLAQQVRGGGRSSRKLLSLPLVLLYRFIALALCSVDIPVSTKVGPRLAIHHGFGIVIHNEASVGCDVIIRHGVTIGSKSGGRAPTIEDGVNIGAGASVIGDIRIGRGAVIGAGSVVVRDVPPYAVAAGNPAKILKGDPT